MDNFVKIKKKRDSGNEDWNRKSEKFSRDEDRGRKNSRKKSRPDSDDDYDER